MEYEPLAVLILLHLHCIGAHDSGWSMKVPSEVRAIEGHPVVLPCTFTHPHHTPHATILAIWKMGHSFSGPVVFQCVSHNGSNTCKPEPGQDPHYRLEGNPREHDLSLRINSATLKDSARYFCRVELTGHLGASFENRMGTQLYVEAPPRILELSADGSAETGYNAMCRAQGSPLPVISWSRPTDRHVQLEEQPAPARAHGQHQTIQELRNITKGGPFTCSASNPLGKDQGTLYLLPFRPSQSLSPTPPVLLLLLSLSLVAKVLLLLGGGVWLLRQDGVYCTTSQSC
uniref:Sialic acid binding Ig like lectin 15 n=1 Tax=Lepisosteus oculatus TaxID=7918 RepID=W5MAG0_LEPOC|nr:PREDICTED: sialic acid-binding Ig-like lectin 15 [Lepisosteus oculatus]